ncbi:MAG: hypothetical protein J0I20_33870 [Chloroflexi bacterium]|nr:hypothetical protein [Chloroflexota bacterium]
MPIYGNYTLALYCENYDDMDPENVFDPNDKEKVFHSYKEFPHEFISREEGSRARNSARAAGWKLDVDKGLAYCPKCVRRYKDAIKPKTASNS